MNTDIELLRQKLAKLPQTANERSYYPLLCEFIQNYASKTILSGVMAISEESLTVDDKNIGFPDITIRRQNGHLIGWWEVKLPADSLSKESFREQFTKYKDSLENILITNLREWQVWQWDDDGKPQKVSEVLFDVSNFAIGEEKKLENLLTKFFEGKPYEAKTPKQLALALAKKALLLSKQVEESFNEQDENSDLVKLKLTFEKTLIQDISTHQFANMIAETMAYSLFLAFLEHIHRGKEDEITLTSAIDYLPTNVPILADLYSLVRQVSKSNVKIQDATQLLIDQLKVSQMDRIYHKLVEHKPGEDPVIQFYEPFLKEYDPKEREARGVYYTPKPVVDYIVRSVDYILREKFSKAKGLADYSVNLLDPATGTGTFLMSAMQEVYARVKKENDSFGEEMVKKEFNEVVLNHVLKHFYAFELMIAPYAIAHLKLTLEAERLGFNFSLTKNDSDSDSDRFKVYLANTLDNPEQPPKDFFGFNSIPEESENARKVKKDVPILAIIGNPPYSNFGQMNKGAWILNLLEDYKHGLNEKKINLDDDFIKFIRFAQWKLQQTGQGIFSMITSNTFLDGITHRQMRRSLMNTFDEIYIYNLHGNLRRGEKCPDGTKDENVFDIQTGVSINIFIKYSQKKSDTVVKYADLWGLRENKFSLLLSEPFEKTGWQIIDVNNLNKKFAQTRWGKSFGGDLNFFVKKQAEMVLEYGSYPGITEIFLEKGLGLKTERDRLTIHFSKKDLFDVITTFRTMNEDQIRNKYSLGEDSRDWRVGFAKKDLLEHTNDDQHIAEFNYRQFDRRFIWYSGKTRGFIGTPGFAVMKQFLNKQNLGLISSRTVYGPENWQDIFVTNQMFEFGIMASRPGNSAPVFPLYLYETTSSQLPLMNTGNVDIKRKHNLSQDLISEVSAKLGLDFKETRSDNSSFTPEDLLYYIYAILHSPSYRSRYEELLKIDFPRVPITSDKVLFFKLINFGNRLVNLHLLGENPFDQSATIYDETDSWGIKIGGQKLEDMADWKVTEVRYDNVNKRIYINPTQYFEGIEKEVWEFMIGGYQVLDKWLKERKKSDRSLATDDLKHFMKIIVSLRETIQIMKEIDQTIPGWPLK